MPLKLSEFEYSLPKELIAQEPKETRDESRLLILNRKERSFKETIFKEIVNFIGEGDVLVLNNTKVILARLFGKRKTGGKLEILLLKEKERGVWEVLVKPAKKAEIGDCIFFGKSEEFKGEVLEKRENGARLMKFTPPEVKNLIDGYGEVPLPPYIKKEIDNPNLYQTVYAEKEGAVACPTAGLHFTKELLERLGLQGVKVVYITLHCGRATFSPVKVENIEDHQMDREFYEIAPIAAEVINRAKREKKKVFACGTTVVRTLESASFINGEDIAQVVPKREEASLYIYPGYKFKMVNSLITNFHLPRSTNLILVSSFAGIEFVRKAYQYAIEKRFRFYSFGDAMLII